jgi:hypothetical protein
VPHAALILLSQMPLSLAQAICDWGNEPATL